MYAAATKAPLDDECFPKRADESHITSFPVVFISLTPSHSLALGSRHVSFTERRRHEHNGSFRVSLSVCLSLTDSPSFHSLR